MKIGSFLNNIERTNVRYSYKKRGTDEAYLPDMACEAHESDYYTDEYGNLFFDKEVSWYGAKLLDGGIDICVELMKKSYADHVEVDMGDASGFESIEIITKENGRERKIGLCKAQSGKSVTDGSAVIPVGVYCDNITVRINASYLNVSIKRLDIFGAYDTEECIYPIPEKIAYNGEALETDGLTLSADGADAEFAASYFAGNFADKFGKEIKSGKGGKSIEFCIAERNDDGFEISCTKSGCVVTAGGRRGLLYAADALLGLSDGKTIKGCEINDAPFMNFRAVHLALPERGSIGFLHRMIKYVFVPMRYNAVILQISAAMKYDGFPEINEMWLKTCEKYEKGEWPLPAHYGFVGRDILEKREVADLCAYFRRYGMEVIPEIQSWSHCQYITTAYPELAEESGKEEVEENMYVADNRPEDFYKHSMCPLHPRYYEVIFGIAKEVLDVVKPERFVHMGHDEIYQVGICDRCREHDGGKLYADEVTRLNNFIKGLGLRMMIWSDMLQEKNYSTCTAINKLPKDIVMLDFTWYFHPELDIEDNLLKHGFEVIMGNMYSSHYPRFDSRSKKKGIVGAVVSTWVPCTEKMYSFKGKMYDFVYSANCLWSRKYDSSMRLAYGQIVKDIVFDIRKKIGGLNLCGEEKTLSLPGDRDGVPPELYGAIPYKKAAVCSRENKELYIDVDGFADIVTIVHATDISGGRELWGDAVKIGEYVLEYEDGTSVCDIIRYGDNIYKFSSRFGMPLESSLFRHEGYVASYMSKPELYKDIYGNDCTLLKCFIKNSKPDKRIKRLKAAAFGNTDAKIILFEAKTIKN